MPAYMNIGGMISSRIPLRSACITRFPADAAGWVFPEVRRV